MKRWFEFKNIKISSYGDYILSGTSNLDTGSATKREISFVDYDGCQIKDIFYSKRVFEISGFIQAFDEDTMIKLKRRLISACSLKEKFRIKYFNRERIYSAECYFDKLPTFGNRIKWYLPFKLYLTIPEFFWQSLQPHKVNLFKYTDEVSDTFTLPCVFTSIVNQRAVVNNGDEKTYPVFYVKCINPTVNSTVLIKNNTSGKKIIINYETSSDEVLTVDPLNQKVTSNINGNITKYVDIETEFFSLEKGINQLECVSLGNIVTLEYYENYLGV